MSLLDRFPFKFASLADKEEKVTSREIKLTGDCARACLSTKEFKQYREKYATLEARVIDELIREAANMNYDKDCDLSKFGARCLVKLTRLRDLRALLTNVMSDSQRDKDGTEE